MGYRRDDIDYILYEITHNIIKGLNMSKNKYWNVGHNFTKIDVTVPMLTKQAVSNFVDSMVEANPHFEGVDRESITDGMVDTFRSLCYEYIDFLHHECDSEPDNDNQIN